MKKSWIGICLMLAAMPLLTSCSAGLVRSIDRNVFMGEDSGERYLANENKEWEKILGCKPEQFIVFGVDGKGYRNIHDYLYARCGNNFIYGDVENSIVLNMETGSGVQMKYIYDLFSHPKTYRRTEVLLIDVDMSDTSDLRRTFLESELGQKDLLSLLNHKTRQAYPSEMTHLFYAAYVDPEAVRNESHIKKAINEGRDTRENNYGSMLFDPKDWDTSIYANPLSLLSKIHIAFMDDPIKMTQLLEAATNAFDEGQKKRKGSIYSSWIKNAWSHALEVTK